MAKRTKKLTKSSLKLEALEQRQLLAGVVGGGTEVTPGGAGADKFITHPNGNHYDQVLMTGESVSVTNDAGTVTRVSFLDAEGDIVQAEFSGAGKLTVSLAGAKADVAPEKYLQTGVKYMQGTATFTIEGSDASTNFQVFSVGSMTAKTPGLFDGEHLGGNHTADIARITVVADPSMPNGSIMGGIRAGNAVFTASEGVVGITAANVQIQNMVIVGDIDAKGSATPSLVFGATSQFGDVRVTGGDLLQTNGKAIANSNSYLFGLSLEDGTKSDGTLDAKESTAAQITWTGANPGQVQAKNYTLTLNTDTLSGTAGDDVFTSTPNIVTDTSGSATYDSLQNTDTISGGAGTDALNVTFATTATAKPILTGIENVNATFNAAATLDLGGSSGVQNVKAVNSTAAALFTNVGAVGTISIADQKQAVSVDGQSAKTLALNLSNVGDKDTQVTLDLGATVKSKAETLNITANNAFVTVTDSATIAAAAADVATAATVAATGKNKLVFTDGDATITSLGVTGAGYLEVSGAMTGLKTLTAADGGVKLNTTGSTATEFSATTGAGKDELTVAGGNVKAISTGAGDDKVTTATAALVGTATVDLGAGNDNLVLHAVPAAAGAGFTLTGGEGTDTISLSAGDYTTVSTTYSAANLAKITGFETLSITGAALAGGTSLDVSKIAGVTSGQILGVATGGAASITNVGANSAVILKGNLATDDGSLTVSLKDATGSADVLNLTLDQSFTQNNDGASAVIATSDVATVTTTGIETVNFKSTGTRTGDVTDGKADTVVNGLVLADADLVTLNVSGDQKFTFTAAADMKKLATVNLADSTVGGTVSVANAANDAVAITITGSAAGDVIVGSANVDTINAGAGADRIVGGVGADVLSGGAGNDTFAYAAAGQSTLVSMDVISDFSANTYGNGTNGATGTGAGGDASKWTGDVLEFDVAAAVVTAGAKVSVQGNAADAQTYLQNLAADGTANEFGAVLDSSTGKLYVDWDANGTADSVIQLTGVTTISAAAISLI